MDQRMNVFFICAFSAWFCYLTLAQEEGCPSHWLTLSYKSLNCLPIKENGSKCPTSYDCSAYESRDTTVCHAFGKTYNILDPIIFDNESAPCVSNSFCDESDNGMAFVNYTYTQCPFAVHIGCDLIRRPGQCCVQTHCGKREYKEVTCSYRDNIYEEGENFAPSAKEGICKECTCQKGFKGVLEEPYCQETDCKLQLYRSEDLNNGCIPVFVPPLSCCPLKMRCPEESDEVIESTSKVESKSSSPCRFGNLTIPFGDSINVVDAIDCTCDLPPFLTCVHRGSLF